MTKKKQIEDFMRLLQALRAVDPEFPLHYALCLAEISRDEGLSLTALSERTGLALSTISRIVGALSSKRQKGIPYGLIDVKISPAERRRKELFLTAKGYAVISDVCDILDDSTKQASHRA